MGNLQVKKNNIWQPVCVQEYREVSVGKMIVRIPTIEEQKRILSLFGREKDLKRLQILNSTLYDVSYREYHWISDYIIMEQTLRKGEILYLSVPV